jgi:hypothetical protein
MTSIMKTKLDREETFNEIRTRLGKSRRHIRRREKFEDMKVEERKSRMKRRSGIVDGGLAISNQRYRQDKANVSIRYLERHRK